MHAGTWCTSLQYSSARVVALCLRLGLPASVQEVEQRMIAYRLRLPPASSTQALLPHSPRHQTATFLVPRRPLGPRFSNPHRHRAPHPRRHLGLINSLHAKLPPPTSVTTLPSLPATFRWLPSTLSFPKSLGPSFLYSRAFTGSGKPRTNSMCTLCLGVGHSAFECDLYSDGPAKRARGAQAGPRRLAPSQREICINFNHGRCLRNDCPRRHVCSVRGCGGLHASLRCPEKRSSPRKP